MSMKDREFARVQPVKPEAQEAESGEVVAVIESEDIEEQFMLNDIWFT